MFLMCLALSQVLYYICTNALDSHNDPIKYCCYPYFTTEETEAVVGILIITPTATSVLDPPF